jgi:anti-sigma factor RsiW
VKCDHARSLIDAYTTDELDLAAALDVEEHLQECTDCAGELESLHALRRTLSTPSLRYTAPSELRRSIVADLNSVEHPEGHAPRRRTTRFALAAAIGALLLLPWIGLYWNSTRSSANQLAMDATSSHVRSLMGEHLLDVVSTDQHTVKPWFNGKLDFSPSVIDLTADGFPLIGGRLDYLSNRPVAAIVYKRHQHVINLYTWPSSLTDSQTSASDHNGYHLLRWNHNGMTCAAVSDLNQQELREFVNLFRGR